jgi:hypothetical protein
VAAYQDEFVWILVDPTVGRANEEVADEYSFKLEDERGELLTYPTAVFMDAEGKILNTAAGKVEPEAFVKLMDEVLGR